MFNKLKNYRFDGAYGPIKELNSKTVDAYGDCAFTCADESIKTIKQNPSILDRFKSVLDKLNPNPNKTTCLAFKKYKDGRLFFRYNPFDIYNERVIMLLPDGTIAVYYDYGKEIRYLNNAPYSWDFKRSLFEIFEKTDMIFRDAEGLPHY